MNEAHSINAESEKVRRVFTDREYIIPEFQRPYRWSEEECTQLWDDLTGFYEDSQREKYFLGSIVIYSDQNNPETSCVIDGQQRLSTLLLLIKALHDRDTGNAVLENCLKKTDKLTGKVIDEPRLLSEVLEEDKDQLKEIILSSSTGEGQMFRNFECLRELLNDWCSNKDSGEFNKFVLRILDDVLLLPIKCNSLESALEIFQTINDRGMKLDDSDIFKAKIYTTLSEEKKSAFIDDWNELKNPMQTFRAYMHVLRAQQKDRDKEKALRDYFSADNWKEFQNGEDLMKNIQKLDFAEQWVANRGWWKILSTHTNKIYWKYPVLNFLYKYGTIDSGVFVLDAKYKSDFKKLMAETAKYFFFKGIVYNAVNKIKLATFRVCEAIASSENDFVANFQRDVTPQESKVFNKKIEENDYSDRYIRGLSVIAAVQNQKQDSKMFTELLSQSYDVEHILPRQWKSDYYDQWDEESCDNAMNKLGNRMPLEKKVNIKASNLFFAEKKKHYKDSNVQDARDLGESNINEWKLSDFETRHKEVVGRLKVFFKYPKPN